MSHVREEVKASKMLSGKLSRWLAELGDRAAPGLF